MLKKSKISIKSFFSPLLLIGLAFSNTSAYSASFDCKKASNYIEHQICADPTLSRLDEELAEAYKQARSTTSNASSLKQTQLAWLREIRSQCTDTECLRRTYVARIEDLKGTRTETPSPQEAPALRKPVPASDPVRLPTNFRIALFKNFDTEILSLACVMDGYPHDTKQAITITKKSGGVLRVHETEFPAGCGLGILGNIHGAGVIIDSESSNKYGFTYTFSGRKELFEYLQNL